MQTVRLTGNLLFIAFLFSLSFALSSSVEAAGQDCQTRIDSTDVDTTAGKCATEANCPGSTKGFSAQCGSGEICCVGESGGGTGGGGSTTKICPKGFVCRGGIAFPTSTETGLSSAPITTILLNVLRWLLGIFGTIGVIAFVISGIQYLTAAGDEERMKAGKQNMLYSIIGVLIGLLGLVIVTAIDNALRGNPFF